MKIKHTLIQDKKSLLKYLKGFLASSSPCKFLDTETTGLGNDDELLGITLHRTGYVSSFIFVDTPYFKGIPIEDLRTVLNPILSEGEWIFHNGKFDCWVLGRVGFHIPKIGFDTMLAIHIHDPDLQKNMETRIKQDFNITKPKFNEVIGKHWNKIDWYLDTKPSQDKKSGEKIPPIITAKVLGKYAAWDGIATEMLYEKYSELIHKESLTKYRNKNGQWEREESQLQKVLYKIEIPLINVLREMKSCGVNIDRQRLFRMEEEILQSLGEVEESIFEEAGCVFNINSSKQKAEVLYEKMGLPILAETNGGSPSTDKHVLYDLAEEGYEIAKRLLKYSSMITLQTSFISKIPTLCDSDGRLRCSFNSAGTRTGRFSSNGPNLQNQPNNDKFPVREGFIATQDWLLAIGDYSQIEPRLFTHMSQDPGLINIYKKEGDIYQGIANDLSISRKQAKVVVLAVSYGIGPNKLAGTLGISAKEASQLINSGFYGEYKKFYNWKRWVEDSAQRKGYVVNMFGRIRRLPNAQLKGGARFAAMRQAVNTIVQGSAADMFKIGMVKLHEEFKNIFKGTPNFLMQVHDELIVEAPKNIVHDVYEVMKHTMENLLPLRIPIKFEGKVCHNWHQMKDDNDFGVLREELGINTNFLIINKLLDNEY
jgi:DNA polymerase I-like protein with 3'-5' exonuclease and polymerase domains